MITTKAPDAREMLLALGVSSFLADMAIPFVWFIPGAVDPDSASIIEINRAMQRGLKRLGYRRVMVTGVLDEETAEALDEVSGPPGAWVQKPFIRILSDIMTAMRNPERAAFKAQALHGGLGSYFEYGGPPVGPLPGTRPDGVIVTPPGPLGLGAIEFGKGIKDPSNCVGIGGTKETFKALQRAINRIAAKKGTRRTSVDGIIGKGTMSAGLAAVRAAGLTRGPLGSLEVHLWSGPCDALAKKAPAVTKSLNAAADKMGAPKKAPAPPPTRVTDAPDPTKPITRVSAGVLGAAKQYLPFLGIAAGIAFVVAAVRKRKS